MKTFILPIADPHTGSIYGLHPNYIKKGDTWKTVDEAGGWYYVNNPFYYLSSMQLKIWRHYEAGINTIARMKEKQDFDIKIIVMGDAIDGDHHATPTLTTRNEPEQMMAHVAIMEWTKERLGFASGRDELIYIEGTESHTRDNEEILAQLAGVAKFPGGHSCSPFLEAEIQGRLFWFYHHGVAAGYSYSEGKGLYNYISQIYIDRKMKDKRPPEFVMTAHTHKREHQTYRNNGNEVHGLILPPLQAQTRFTRKMPRAVVQGARVGLSPVMVNDGDIQVLNPYMLEFELGDKVVW